MNSQASKKGFKLFLTFPIIAFGLGTWQVYRYNWKMDLMQRARDRMEEEPIELSNDFIKNYTLLNNNNQDTGGDDKSKYEFRRVLINGKVIDDQVVLLGPRSIDGTLGYYIISPLQLNDGTKILINRGWSASTSKSNYKIPHAIEDLKLIHKQEQQESPSSQPSQSIRYRLFNILGVISKSKERGSMFTPINQPELGQWYSLDVDAMSNKLKTNPIMINTIDEHELNPIENSLPNPQFKRFDTNIENAFHNKHMSYIGTWYTLSASLFFIYYKYMRKLPK